jgi:hypothetical protein
MDIAVGNLYLLFKQSSPVTVPVMTIMKSSKPDQNRPSQRSRKDALALRLAGSSGNAKCTGNFCH